MPTKRKQPISADDLESRAEELTRRVSARAKPERDDEEDERDEPAAPPESKRVVIEDDEDDEGDDGEEREPRSERRAARSRERGRLHRENEDLKRRLEELERRPPPPVVVHAPPPGGPAKSPEDEAYERDMRAIFAESDQIAQREAQLSARKDAAGNIVGATPEERNKLREEWFALEQRRMDLQAGRAIARQGGGGRGTSPEQVNQAILMGEFPDVFATPGGQPTQMLRWGHARHQQLLAEGAPNSLDTARKALNEARSRFGSGSTPRRAAPPPERRARYESISRGGGGSDGEDERPRSVVLSKQQMAMAEERFPNMKPDAAHREFAKRVLLKKRERA